MQNAIPTTSPEFRLWLSLIVAKYTRRARLNEERRAYWSRFLTSWVAEDPDPGYSALDQSDGLGVPDSDGK